MQRFDEWKHRLVFQRSWREDGQYRRIEKIDREHFETQLRNKVDLFWSIERYNWEAVGCSEFELDSLDAVCSFHMDFDAHDGRVTLLRSIRAVRKVSNWFQKQLGLADEQIFVWFSGRGFHLALPAETTMRHPRPQPLQEYGRLARYIARELGLSITATEEADDGEKTQRTIHLVDFSLYRPRGLIRVPGSLNSKSRIAALAPKIRLPLPVVHTLAKKPTTQDFHQSMRLLIQTKAYAHWPLGASL